MFQYYYVGVSFEQDNHCTTTELCDEESQIRFVADQSMHHDN